MIRSDFQAITSLQDKKEMNLIVKDDAYDEYEK